MALREFQLAATKLLVAHLGALAVLDTNTKETERQITTGYEHRSVVTAHLLIHIAECKSRSKTTVEVQLQSFSGCQRDRRSNLHSDFGLVQSK